MTDIRISVIVPVFNAEALIEAALAKLTSLDHPAVEVVFVDDGSSDATSDMLRRCEDPRVRWRSWSNAGPSAARNVGARMARGRWLTFFDADDERARWHLLRAVRLSEKRRSAHQRRFAMSVTPTVARRYWRRHG